MNSVWRTKKMRQKCYTTTIMLILVFMCSCHTILQPSCSVILCSMKTQNQYCSIRFRFFCSFDWRFNSLWLWFLLFFALQFSSDESKIPYTPWYTHTHNNVNQIWLFQNGELKIGVDIVVNGGNLITNYTKCYLALCGFRLKCKWVYCVCALFSKPQGKKRKFPSKSTIPIF